MVNPTPAQPTPVQAGSLLRILGVSFGIAVALGGTIGVGILRSPGIVAGLLPDSRWMMGAWIIGGIYAFLGTLCVAELGTSWPRAGGWYSVTRASFGDFAGFAIGWSFWLALASALSYASTAIGEYLSVLIPVLNPKVAGMLTLVLFTTFQVFGLRPVAKFQQIIGFMKGIVLLALIVSCIAFAPKEMAPLADTVPLAIFPLALAPAIVAAMQAITKAYDGWHNPFCFAEETRDPGKNLPKSMMIGTSMVIVIYIGMNLALLSVLHVPEIAASKLPAAAAFTKIFGSATGRVVTGLAIILIAGLLNTLFLSSPRVLFAMARDGLFFPQAAKVTPKGVPLLPVLISGGAALLMSTSGSFAQIFGISSIFSVVCNCAGCLSLFALRRKFPDLPRPFKVPGYPIVPGLMVVGSLAFLVGVASQNTKNAIWAFALLLASYPVYRLLRRNSPPTPPLNQIPVSAS